MKKLFMIAMLMVGSITLTMAQNDTVIYIANHPSGTHTYLCLNQFNRVIIYGLESCNDFYWINENGDYVFENPIIIDGVSGDGSYFYGSYNYLGCSFEWWIYIEFVDDDIYLPSEITQTVWKHQGEILQLQPVGNDSLGEPYWYEYQWSTGSTEPVIEITEPGIYTCEMSVRCGTAIRTFIVRDNVEISLATCDLESNLNMVTWETTEAQAEYISQVEVKRDGLVVGTAPYTDGQFIDNIGSDAASRTYTVTAIATDGMLCPLMSHPKETIHMAYLTGINNTIEVNWNTPTGYDLLGYNICEWHEDDGTLSVIDYVGASVSSYTCSESQFDEGYIVIQGVETGKNGETRLLSNRSLDIVGIGEQQSKIFKIYPNPSNGDFTVQGATDLTVYNMLGQVVATSHCENGVHTFSLGTGIYFVKSDKGIVQKVIVK